MNENITSKLKNNIWRLVILTIAGSLIYGLPYFRSYYYDAYLETYHLTNTQMGTFGSIFGILGAISYLFGGVVADMVSPRKIMSVSLILTGAAGLLHLMHPSYGMLVVIYLIWGFTSLFAFWPALLKGLRGIAAEHEQSKAYGSMGGGILADRLGRSKVMFIGFFLMGVSTFIIALLPNMSVPFFIVVCAIIYLGMYLNYGIVFSMMEEGGIPASVAGTAIGVVCTLGYLPEVICPTLAGHVLDTYTELGYKYYFIGVGIVMVVGIAALLIWNRYLAGINKKNSREASAC
ncbi:MFS transporter [Emergencia sp. 1XD21-10]|uniref:MFS transporter n=1 Tax=Emergencia sp. 1XD21-10 TaxID=2304569 RepID=UPI00137A8123|nr:MFS transporter [Emergencia sp. 1XD21-10]NCE98267.1 MFS transporter [Emergencia sp. 1XD21-10]